MYILLAFATRRYVFVRLSVQRLLQNYVIGCIRFRDVALRAVGYPAVNCKLSMIRADTFRRNKDIA